MTDAKPLPALVVDAMLGRLARWCRLAGFDTIYEPTWSDDVLLAQCMHQQKILVTRDRALIQRAQKVGVRCINPDSDDWEKQFINLVRALRISPNSLEWFGRCVACNTPVVPTPPAKVRRKIPVFVYRKHRKFFRCPRCGKIYWSGSHFRAVDARRRALAHIENPGL